MSKLSPSLKGLINAPFARPGPTPAPRNIEAVYTKIADEARERKYGEKPWLALSAAATFTLNSPSSLGPLLTLASSRWPSSSSSPSSSALLAPAEFIREIGLKCISFNGIPRTINTLNSFRSHLSSAHPDLSPHLSSTPTRQTTPSNISAVHARGRQLWESIYTPLDTKLEAKLAEAHPDLPVHILGSHYGPLLSDPPSGKNGLDSKVGRSLTSVVAIACLRAQTGVGPQVLSHVFGLRKAVEQGAHLHEFAAAAAGQSGGEGSVKGEKERKSEEEAEGIERLASDEGCEWILRSVDAISEAMAAAAAAQDGNMNEGGFASPMRKRESKL
ncbi:hypothetical protein GE21DRAFT_10560 [Neurospora crassa]|uniref:Dol-P-Man:Man(5)GlcNAc(2)-PP-Dol alpha-1,3-mannosyltransferase n=1 Tax=Neurospora crassa (strain ATCC 24698 / 74-OR23-1A / CBS 708.71 / DSM 1257 / FGSC 987) TaxID=367110 RepID=Q7S4A1_NEUCR|nr:hypothetical protein NCU08146 [Neurospora crassa OR74A]EAA30321.1 hypothetical protein NCU08146 [Neurospora crassa OR74A]KHE79203.1 hypothetical protein GE21DRAFT_10560 [Neurospora crassa]|eukprot:XP_959557.1 hypothetical protein NCU08146 [Neurospora crassa OR74A]